MAFVDTCFGRDQIHIPFGIVQHQIFVSFDVFRQVYRDRSDGRIFHKNPYLPPDAAFRSIFRLNHTEKTTRIFADREDA